MNERFVKVFELLKKRGDIVLNDRNGRGIGDFAEKIVGKRAYGHIIRAFLNEDDKRVIDYRHAKALCKSYGINEEYMLYGRGEPLGITAPTGMAVDGQGKRQGNILFTSVQAFAGSGVDVGTHSQSREEFTYFSMPGLEGDGLVAFPIEGDSMDPLIYNGDIIICREIEGVHEVKENRVYAVKNNGSLWVKYLQCMRNSKGRVDRLKLISANYLYYEPFEEEVNEYTRLYKVVHKIGKVD